MALARGRTRAFVHVDRFTSSLSEFVSTLYAQHASPQHVTTQRHRGTLQSPLRI